MCQCSSSILTDRPLWCQDVDSGRGCIPKTVLKNYNKFCFCSFSLYNSQRDFSTVDALLDFTLLCFDTGSYVAQAGLKVTSSSDPLACLNRVAGTTGMCHHTSVLATF